MYSGSCLCRAVKYQVNGELGDIVLCHCSNCRKATGSAFASVAPVKTAELQVISGRESMAEFQSMPGVYRVFCRHCGSPLYSRRPSMPDILRLRVGTLDTPLHAKPSMHIFVGSKAEWFDICDHAPQFEERPV